MEKSVNANGKSVKQMEKTVKIRSSVYSLLCLFPHENEVGEKKIH